MIQKILDVVQDAKTSFKDKNKKNTEIAFKKLNEIDYSKLSRDDQEKSAGTFTQNALDCFLEINGEKYPLDEFRLYCAKEWLKLAKSLNPEDKEIISSMEYAENQITMMETTVDDGVKHWYIASIVIWVYLIYSSFSAYIESAKMAWSIRFIFLGCFGLTLLYKYASTVPGYIALRRNMDKVAIENILIKFIGFFSEVSKNLPDMYIVTKVNGRVTNVKSDIAFNSLKLFGPVANYVAVPLILPLISFGKIMQKHFKYEYHYEEKEYLNFQLVYRIFKFAKNAIKK